MSEQPTIAKIGSMRNAYPLARVWSLILAKKNTRHVDEDGEHWNNTFGCAYRYMADKRLRENAMKMLPIIGVVAAGIFLGPSAFAETVMYKATLTASAVIPANDSKGSGKADVTFDTATKKLSWKVSYDKLTGEPIAAHFHGPAGPKDNAGPVVDVTAKIKDGSATITDAQAADLAAGKWYLNVHTEKFPDGEIRGQVEKVK